MKGSAVFTVVGQLVVFRDWHLCGGLPLVSGFVPDKDVTFVYASGVDVIEIRDELNIAAITGRCSTGPLSAVPGEDITVVRTAEQQVDIIKVANSRTTSPFHR